MQILILYFSGTGNTQFISEWLFEKLEKSNYHVDIYSIVNFPKNKIGEYDILILGYPVYETNSPIIVRDWIKGLKLELNRKIGVFVFCTMGAFAGNTNRKTLKLLEKQGFRPLGSGKIRMPGSDGLCMLKEVSWMVKKAKESDFDHKKGAEKLFKEISDTFERIRKMKTKSNVELGKAIESISKSIPLSILGYLLDPLVHWLYKLLSKRLIHKMRIDESCIHCNRCIEICPIENIKEQNNEIIFGSECILCMRCINQCPAEAIQIGKMTKGKFRWKGPKGDFKPLKHQYKQSK